MRNRHVLLAIAGGLLLVTGVMALWWPVYLGQYDQFGVQISCGRGFSADLTQVANAEGDDLVDRCGTALLLRRAWSIPVLVLGWLILTALVLGWLHSAPGARALDPGRAGRRS